MKSIKNLLLLKSLLALAVIFQISFICAGESVSSSVQALGYQKFGQEDGQGAVDCSQVSENLEKLVQDVLAAKCPSLGKKIGLNVAREMAKMGVVMLFSTLAAKLDDKEYKKPLEQFSV